MRMLIALGLLAVPEAEAQTGEVAPFGGLQYGGAFESAAGERVSLDALRFGLPVLYDVVRRFCS